jgi:LacI family transcriptional regulator
VRAHCVAGDHALGGRLVAEHLYGRGHRVLGVVTGPADSSDSAQRLKGFTAFLRERGVALDPRLIRCGEFQEEPAYRLTDQLLDARKDLTAIFCCNDNMALGVLRRLRERDIPCPARVSVVGYDDTRQAAEASPALTSVRVPLYDMAQEGTRHLLRYLDRHRTGFFGRTSTLPVTLVPRASVGDCNPRALPPRSQRKP